MIELNKIYPESNLETMQRIESNSIDMVLTSPPYANARAKTYGGIDADDYINWFIPIAREIYRILKPTGSFILNIGDNTIDGETHLYTFEIPIVLKREIGFKFIDPLIWHKKTTPPGKFKNRFKDGWEFCFHFSKTLDIKFNPYAVAEKTTQVSIERAARHKEYHNKTSLTGSGFTNGSNFINKRRNRSTGSGFGTDDEYLDTLELALPMNVIYCSPETRNMNHSAPFPIEIPVFFIKAFTDENDIIYDPFLGSGTTAEAALRLNRKFIGSEIKTEYVSTANNRIKEHLVSLFS